MAPAFASWRALGSRSARAAVKKVLVLEDDDVYRVFDDDDDVYYYIRWRLKLEGETENMGVCTKERKGITAAVLMATPCTNSLGGESGEQKHEGREGRRLCWKYAAVSGSGAGGRRC
jgi:hypothetical protein